MRDQERPARGSDRSLYLFGELTDELSQEICARLVEGWGRDHTLFINSDGGSSFNALALVNLMKLHGRVDTVCLGVALSGAADTLAAGRRRFVLPNAIAMIHQVSWDLGHEVTANLLKNARFLERLNQQLTELLAEDCGQSVERVTADIATDHYLFGQEIIDYGLADEFWDPTKTGLTRGGPRFPRHISEESEPRRREVREDPTRRRLRPRR